ncbi:MAG TPA: cbb3-type cytochrome c oxidase subunit I, partial [Flavobacterium sp.]|nr:cbb3-type cytochrome c oxidase subunit I [Flavobacterium sp.]
MRKAHIYFYLTALLLLLIGLVNSLLSEDTYFDINVHDTYYVVNHFYAYALLANLYLLPGLLYWICHITKLKLIKWLTAAHTALSIGAIPVYYLLILYANLTNNPDNLIDNTSEIVNGGIIIICL